MKGYNFSNNKGSFRDLASRYRIVWPQESSNQSDRDQPLITTLDRRHPPGLLRDSPWRRKGTTCKTALMTSYLTWNFNNILKQISRTQI